MQATEPRTGVATREMFYHEALGDALRLEMERDPRVIVMGEDIAEAGGAFQVTAGLLDTFGPTRVRQTPISELGIVGAAVGAALTGLRPMVELMYIDFAGLAMDQLVNQAAQNRFMFGGQARVPMVMRTQGGSGRGNAAQHSKSLEAWFTHVAGLKVVMPSTPADAKGLLSSAIRDDDPVIFLESEGLYAKKGPVGGPDDLVPLGKAAVRRRGGDCTVIAISRMVWVALSAAETLAGEGIECEVIDPRSLRPLDLETLAASVRRTNRAVIVEEGWPESGVGANLAARLYETCFDHLDAPIARISSADVPMPYAKNLEQAALPGPDDVAAAVRGLVRGGGEE